MFSDKGELKLFEESELEELASGKVDIGGEGEG